MFYMHRTEDPNTISLSTYRLQHYAESEANADIQKHKLVLFNDNFICDR